MRSAIAALAVLSVGSGCFATLEDPSPGGDEDGAPGTIVRDDCDINDEHIGADGLILVLGPKSVTFHDWVAKVGEDDEYVGFSITLGGTSTIGYVVKAGGERYHSTDTVWSIPPDAGAGSEVRGISRIDFCEECEDGGCDGVH